VRWYSLTISDPNSGFVYKPDPNGRDSGFTVSPGGATFTSTVTINGQTVNNPGALNIEFDLAVYPWHTAQGGSVIRVWGVGLKMIGQASNLNGKNFALSAGMMKGLPLANPAQAGLIVQGQIYQAFGNWQGTQQSLDLIGNPGGLDPANGISFTWLPGVPLATALASTFAQAFPGYSQSIKISSSLLPPNNAAQYGTYASLEQFASYIQQITQPIGAQFAGPNYPGVQITVVGNTITALDTTVATKTVQLAFQDLIGQPTWIGPATVNFKTVLRADIQIGTQVIFPQGVIAPYALTSSKAAVPNAPSRSKTVFQGSFTVNEVHHFANFRQADADSWNTTFNAVVSGGAG